MRAPLPPAWQHLVQDGRGALSGAGLPGGHSHLAEELQEEAVQAGLVDVEVHGLEGPGGLALDVDGCLDPDLTAALAPATAPRPPRAGAAASGTIGG